MPSNKEYLNFILEQLSLLSNIKTRSMMGEYIIYYNNKIIGGIYDNTFLLKNLPQARTLMPNATLQQPYPNAKEMLVVDNLDDKEFLKNLINNIYPALPFIKQK